MAGTAEAMLLGSTLGLSPELLASILNTSTGKCWPSESCNPAPGATPKTPAPADRGYAGGFGAKLMAKGKFSFFCRSFFSIMEPDLRRDDVDLNLAIAAAASTSTPLPVGGLTSTLYNTLAQHDEFASKDFSVVYEYLRIAREGGLPSKSE